MPRDPLSRMPRRHGFPSGSARRTYGKVIMEPPAAPRVRKSRAWIGFFVVLVVLGVAAVVLPIVSNLRQQLRPEQLAEARQLWLDKGPSDYDLTFAVTYDRDPRPERHVVLVRGGKVVLASSEGEIIYLAFALRAAVGLPAGGLAKDGRQDVPAIFEHIEALLRAENSSNRGNFLIAVFDPKDGHPRRLVFRQSGTSTREEWSLRLLPAGALDSSSKR
jgi:hypothetical protein